MMKKSFYAFLISIFVLTTFNLHKIEATEKVDTYGSSLIKALQEGGYLLYFRHGETIGQDQSHVDFNDCKTQKNLTITGKEQARWIGVFFSQHKIPTNPPILVSPYCRTRETAEIAFGKQNIKVVPFLANIEYLRSEKITQQEEQDIIEKLNKIFEIPVHQGTNKIIIGHTFSPDKVLGEIPYMGMVIIKPNGVGRGYKIVKKLSIDELIKDIQTHSG